MPSLCSSGTALRYLNWWALLAHDKDHHPHENGLYTEWGSPRFRLPQNGLSQHRLIEIPVRHRLFLPNAHRLQASRHLPYWVTLRSYTNLNNNVDRKSTRLNS